jgi:hypothetical protein
MPAAVGRERTTPAMGRWPRRHGGARRVGNERGERVGNVGYVSQERERVGERRDEGQNGKVVLLRSVEKIECQIPPSYIYARREYYILWFSPTYTASGRDQPIKSVLVHLHGQSFIDCLPGKNSNSLRDIALPKFAPDSPNGDVYSKPPSGSPVV